MEENKDLVYALCHEMCSGFGFQVEPERECLYVAQVFRKRAEAEKTFGHSMEEMPKSALALVHDRIPADKIWITDFLGREWVTIHISYFNAIEHLFNVLLQNGYFVLTHTTPKAYFKPGEVFSRRELDLHIIATFRENFEQLKKCNRTDRECYDFLKDIMHTRALMRYENWAADEGHALCMELRRIYRKKDRDPAKTRYSDARFVDACTTHGVLYAGGWYAYDPRDTPIKKSAPPEKRPKVDELAVVLAEDMEECMICLDAPANTLVHPCGHCVVCSACSRGLRATPDARTCVRCRRTIEWVSYGDTNEMERK